MVTTSQFVLINFNWFIGLNPFLILEGCCQADNQPFELLLNRLQFQISWSITLSNQVTNYLARSSGYLFFPTRMSFVVSFASDHITLASIRNVLPIAATVIQQHISLLPVLPAFRVVDFVLGPRTSASFHLTKRTLRTVELQCTSSRLTTRSSTMSSCLIGCFASELFDFVRISDFLSFGHPFCYRFGAIISL